MEGLNNDLERPWQLLLAFLAWTKSLWVLLGFFLALGGGGGLSKDAQLELLQFLDPQIS